MSRGGDAPRYAVGVDYGTNACRALVVDVRNGREIGTGVFAYPTGAHGVILDRADPHLARQNPRDYIDGFVAAARDALTAAARNRSFRPDRVVGIGVDTTGSTPLPVDAAGVPLAFQRRFRRRPAAQAWLWKDHTGHAEAAEITAKAQRSKAGYLRKCGGTYSSEWYWSKILRCWRVDPEVFDAAASWVEAADFIPGWITGNHAPATMARGICPAGHKAMYHDEWGGLPSKQFLRSLDPALVRLRDAYARQAVPADRVAGLLTAAFAEATGLPVGTPVAVGTFDAHAGGVGSGIGPGTLVKILGTSTCDMMVAPGNAELADIPGLCGIVPGSIIPGMYGLEAGQSAVGDIFNWFVDHVAGGQFDSPADAHAALTREAGRLRAGESGLLALDWNNGNRTVLVDPLLTGLLVGQTLYTTPAEIYRALIEATAFGALTIIRRFEEYGVKVRHVVNCGGISAKNDLVLQVYADVCNRPMKISRSAETCALGAAIFGSVAGGAHRTVRAAQRRMTGLKKKEFRPNRDAVRVYARLYEQYRKLHDAFGTSADAGPLGGVMKELISIRDAVRAGQPVR
jgi:L-ribulokinase